MRDNEQFRQNLLKEWNDVYRYVVRDVELGISCINDVENQFVASIKITFVHLKEDITIRITFYRYQANDIPLFINRLYRMAESIMRMWDPQSYSH